MAIPESCFDPDMEVGQTKRFRHDCSDKWDKPLAVTRTYYGWKWMCHRCDDESGAKRADRLSPDELVRQRTKKSEVTQPPKSGRSIVLPEDFTMDIPPVGLAWLWKYGITDDEQKSLKFGYSPHLGRVILPVYDDGGELLYYQARNVHKVTDNNPKYLNVKKTGRDGIWFKQTNPIYNGSTVAVVEDIISTVVVGRVCDCYGLLYAYIPDDLILYLSQMYDEIVLWLDWDKMIPMIKKVNRYLAFGINVRRVLTSKDPKSYDVDRIRKELGV